ncbi:hypothetical protein [Flavobacterium restrictum]|uniref:Uncharacterized protein n=1 Tax=Flavobacterium restrictum TaxID=2594428 RepID=A0A553DQT6_9FLAO|nr:hypothetical protein [Flavobacterium restrictum]TRX35076.1 hypothetical protein FNW21_15600 [Flavobacterium restrictum]
MIKKMMIIFTLLIGLNAVSQEDNLKFKILFYKNSKPIDGLKCYIIGKENKAYLLPSKNDTIVIKDTVKSKGIPLLVLIDNHTIVFPFYYYKKSNYINIYYDNRIFGNTTKKKFGLNRWKHLFRREYYVDIEGLDDMITVFKTKTKFILINN